MLRRDLNLPLALVLLILLILLPFATESFVIKTVTEVLIYAIFAMSLDLLVGYTGLISFGHAAFFGIGAYAAGYLAQNISPNLLLNMPLTLLLVAGYGFLVWMIQLVHGPPTGG